MLSSTVRRDGSSSPFWIPALIAAPYLLTSIEAWAF
jgi:hypothetical protein